MKTPVPEKKIPSTNLFPVVGIGASAGGLDAFKRFLKAIPVDSGLAYVLVQHLDPSHKSFLPELLQKVTSLPVLEITDDIVVAPDHIYIIPSNKTLLANDGVLELSDRPKKSQGQLHLPIDLFFTSLAQIHGKHAIGVLLSGNGSDGTLGLTAIKEGGGICFAQDSASSANDRMPASAVNAGIVDHILPPEEMPATLVLLKKQADKMKASPAEPDPPKDVVYGSILALLLQRKGVDFIHYKESTIRRRIARRMELHDLTPIAAYLDLLDTDPQEQDSLFQDLLIPVTSFFRDPLVFDTLQNSIFPELLKTKQEGAPVRIWVAACSTGQEAYSIAMCLKDALGSRSEVVQIFATDISAVAIEKARKGVYDSGELEGVPPEQLAKYFTIKGGQYHIIKLLRDQCVFAVHNFLKDAPFGKLDLISCRNVLIYMSPYLQKKALTTFHYGLRTGGMLLLGKSETVHPAPGLFGVLNKAEKVFHRKATNINLPHTLAYEVSADIRKAAMKPVIPMMNDYSKVADEIILRDHTPPGVVINAMHEVVQFRGHTGIFLESPAGKPSHHVLKMARNVLAFELRTLLAKAQNGQGSLLKDNISFVISGIPHLVSIEVIVLPTLQEAYYLVLFRDCGVNNALQPATVTSQTAGEQRKNAAEQQIVQLEWELEQNRENVRTIITQQEELNQELQGANEELMSGNEELQSLNEELETSKEELQSTNEELITLNEHYNVARQYAEAIVETIREPVIVLDRELRVKSANSAFYRVFGETKNNTEGALIYELSKGQWNIPALRTLLERIMPWQSSFTGFEVRLNLKGLGERIMVLNAVEMAQGKEEEKLILLAFDDVTENTLRLLQKKELLTRFQALVMQAPVAMCILKGADHLVEVANEYYLRLLGKDEKILDRPIGEAMPELKEQGIIALLDEVLSSGKPYYGYEQELLLHRNGVTGPCYFNFVYQPMLEPNLKVTGIIVVVAEVTDQVTARKRMESQATMVRNLIMTAPGFVCTLNGPEHVYDLVNEQYQSLFGSRQIKGKPIMLALPELVGQGFESVLNKVYNTGEPYLGIDVPIRLASDEGLEPEERYFNFSYQPIYDDNKVIFGILVFGYEVTEQLLAKNRILELQQKHATLLEEEVEQRTAELWLVNQALLAKNEELVKMNHELESFNYVSSHDLQEPLRKIATYISRLQDTDAHLLSKEGKHYFQTIQECALRMRTLITDLMAYAVMDVNEQVLEPASLCELIMDVQNVCASLLEEKSGSLEVIGDCDIAVNSSRMHQVFTNLISNSIKFSRPDVPPRIMIEIGSLGWEELQNEVPPIVLSILPHQGRYCRIRLTDNGIGFNDQYNEKIFEIFQRLHSHDAYKGTGIGLAIVKKIVEQHHGYITAQSDQAGATFRIYLPIQFTSEQAAATKKSKK